MKGHVNSTNPHAAAADKPRANKKKTQSQLCLARLRSVQPFVQNFLTNNNNEKKYIYTNQNFIKS